ncbi:hypothetical protein GWK47_040425 [Chionoecetes opilio]|uniref:ILEI/PANDER domain-containing protein n=1 Tax=Chionoecetes opilio TaxID=41210 RepID=A0A8J4YC84_CHIOP|nr:hypothetical protein GWK47_040425 [Chionoecetes opilio]
MKWVIVMAFLTLHAPPLPASIAFTSAQRFSTITPPSIFPTRPRHAAQALLSLHPRHPQQEQRGHGGTSLSAALHTLVTQELARCSLVVAADADHLASRTLNTLARLPNQKQVVGVAGGWAAAGRRVVWRARGCRAYIFLLQHPEALLSFANSASSLWDYDGRLVLAAGLTEYSHLWNYQNILAVLKNALPRYSQSPIYWFWNTPIS